MCLPVTSAESPQTSSMLVRFPSRSAPTASSVSCANAVAPNCPKTTARCSRKPRSGLVGFHIPIGLDKPAIRARPGVRRWLIQAPRSFDARVSASLRQRIRRDSSARCGQQPVLNLETAQHSRADAGITGIRVTSAAYSFGAPTGAARPRRWAKRRRYGGRAT